MICLEYDYSEGCLIVFDHDSNIKHGFYKDKIIHIDKAGNKGIGLLPTRNMDLNIYMDMWYCLDYNTFIHAMMRNFG